MKQSRKKLVKQIAAQLAMEFMALNGRARRAPAKRLAKRVVKTKIETDVKAAAAPAERKPIVIPAAAIERSKQKTPRFQRVNPFALPAFPVQLTDHVPENRRMAMDDGLTGLNAWAGGAWGAVGGNVAFEGVAFLGYPYLSELAQRPEYRVIVETIATEMTRKWIRLQGKGEKDKTKKIAQLNDELDRLKVRDVFCKVCEVDGYFGRGHIYLDTGQGDDRDELKTPIGNGDNKISDKKFAKGSLKRLAVIEPVWTYPSSYNSNDPLKPDWYNPQLWFVMSKEIHASRCLRFVGREVPDMLKPAYSFGGLSMTQMAKPYVENWLNTRQSVADIIQAFSVFVLGTNLAESLSPQGGQLFDRVDLFNNTRDNRGTMVIDTDTEEFQNVSAPLGTLDALQAQTQEHMCVQAGTLIETGRGQVPIEEVTLEDRVWTRAGLRAIKWVGVTGHRETLVKIEAGNSVIKITEEHPVWSETTKEFVNAIDVSTSHCLLGLDNRVNTASPLHGVGVGGGERNSDTSATKKLAAFSIGRFGKLTSVLSRSLTKFITETVTAATTAPTTLKWSLALSTWRWMGETVPFLKSDTRFGALLAETGSGRSINPRCIVPEPAKLALTSFDRAGNRSRLTASCANAAEHLSQRSERRSLGSVLARACSVPVARVSRIKVERQPVYNIEVIGPPEFFANGILIHNSAVSRIPLIKLLGISPHGLNATAEPELRVFYDTIKAQQEKFFSPNLRKVIAFAQLNIWGKVDPDIEFVYEPLWSLDEKGEAEVKKTEAETGQILIDAGVIRPEEERARIANDPDTPYHGLDADDVPDLKEEEEAGLIIRGEKGEGGESDDADANQE